MSLELHNYSKASNGAPGVIEVRPYEPTESDVQMMGLAISAAAMAARAGDSPIGAVLIDPDKEVYVEETREFRDGNLFGHAELALIRRVQPKVGRDLGGCTMYSVAEPCYGCCYPIDKGGLKRLYVAALRSDVDFFTRKEPEMPSIFANSRRRLEVVSGLLLPEARKLFTSANRRHWGDNVDEDLVKEGA
ncbi:nucleoside deaminase [Candidatus Saccharibacteria bacterium]|nr:MAG: nucleoside deaminase [Candidatus Saccharibacteria bacterium]